MKIEFPRKLLRNERGVSTIVAVVLMVAMAIFLGTVFGLYLIETAAVDQPAPETELDFQYNVTSQTMTIVHDGSDTITKDNTGMLVIAGEPRNSVSESHWNAEYLNASDGEPHEATIRKDIAVTTVIIEDVPVTAGETIKLFWESPSGERTELISEKRID